VRMVVSDDVDAVTAVEFQHAAIDVLRRQRPPCIDIDMAQVGLLDCAGARSRRLPLVSDGYRKPETRRGGSPDRVLSPA
jgi:hypothetical protein